MDVDCVIVGGGAAGLSAALVLGRARRRTLVVDLADGARVATRRILLATGMQYRTPALPGLAALWGHSVFHCPFCHGWEVRGQPLAECANGVRAGMLVAATLHQRSTLAGRLGVEFADPGPVAVDALKVDALCRTTVAGVFAAGDVSAQLPQVAAAVAGGSLAAAAVVQSLLAEDVGLPVPV